jgi:hypothetical protein
VKLIVLYGFDAISIDLSRVSQHRPRCAFKTCIRSSMRASPLLIHHPDIADHEMVKLSSDGDVRHERCARAPLNSVRSLALLLSRLSCVPIDPALGIVSPKTMVIKLLTHPASCIRSCTLAVTERGNMSRFQSLL